MVVDLRLTYLLLKLVLLCSKQTDIRISALEASEKRRLSLGGGKARKPHGLDLVQGRKTVECVTRIAPYCRSDGDLDQFHQFGIPVDAVSCVKFIKITSLRSFIFHPQSVKFVLSLKLTLI